MDAAAFKQTVCSCIDRMYGVAVAITGSEADAADAVQDACMKLWERRGSLGGVANVAAYACGAARNAAIDIVNRRRQAIGADEMVALASDADIERDYERREQLEGVKKLLASLPDGQRIVFAMREFEGCTMEEIESATGFSSANVRVLLCRARGAVKKYFAKI